MTYRISYPHQGFHRVTVAETGEPVATVEYDMLEGGWLIQADDRFMLPSDLPPEFSGCFRWTLKRFPEVRAFFGIREPLEGLDEIAEADAALIRGSHDRARQVLADLDSRAA